MKRRTFLRWSSAGVTGALLPRFMGSAFAQEPGADTIRESDLETALAAARGLGKPLLVFVIPESDEGRHVRGEAFGDLFTYADRELLANLALCEVVCAPRSAFREHLPHTRVTDGAWLVLVEAGASEPPSAPERRSDTRPRPFRARSIAGPDGPRPSLGWETKAEDARASYAKWIRPVGLRLSAAITGGSRTLRRRELDARRALGVEASARCEQLFQGTERPKPHELLRGAAIFRSAAEETETRGIWIELLAGAVTTSIVRGTPRGARWAGFDGCAYYVEGAEDSVGIDCGMGHVPESTRRMLWFFTEDWR